jgi:hypothetical protein
MLLKDGELLFGNVKKFIAWQRPTRLSHVIGFELELTKKF